MSTFTTATPRTNMSVQAARKMLRFAGPVRGGAVRALAVHGSTGARRAAGASGRLAGRPACVGLAASPLGPHRTGDAPVRWRSVATASERRLPGESIKLTTRDEIEGEHNESEMGIVVGTAARSKNLLHDLFQRIKGLLGGTLPSYEDLFTNTTAEATHNAMLQAERLGGNAIIRVRYQTSATDSQLTGVSCYVICYGTAVQSVAKH